MTENDPRSEHEREREEKVPAEPTSEDERLLDEEIKTLPLRVRERIKLRRPEMDDDVGPGMDWIDN